MDRERGRPHAALGAEEGDDPAQAFLCLGLTMLDCWNRCMAADTSDSLTGAVRKSVHPARTARSSRSASSAEPTATTLMLPGKMWLRRWVVPRARSGSRSKSTKTRQALASLIACENCGRFSTVM
jgi:hypothetical protein